MRTKIITILLSLLFIINACKKSPTESDQQYKDDLKIIQEIINETNLETLSYFVKMLSGRIAANINGNISFISSRHKNYQGNDRAADLINQILLTYELRVQNQLFSQTGRNVYGIQTGTDYPVQYYILCAHYDSMPDSSVSPGADDNASGTAAVLEAARILKNYHTKYSIVYALWDEEEQGLIACFRSMRHTISVYHHRY